MTDLDRLIEAVAAGSVMKMDFVNAGISPVAFEAFIGSLDAAKCLHDALLPGISQFSIVTDPTCLCVKVAWWPHGLSGDTEIQGEGWDEGNPARAWLLAILRAVKAKG